jgi:hypothetical protein
MKLDKLFMEANSDRGTEHSCLELICLIFQTLRSYWGYSIEKTLDVFNQKGIYKFIHDNYDFYHTVGTKYIVEDLRECLDLPKGSWKRVEVY